MAKNAYVGVEDTARQVKEIYVGVNGVARKVVKGYVGVEGVARQFWPNAAEFGAYITAKIVDIYGGDLNVNINTSIRNYTP